MVVVADELGPGVVVTYAWDDEIGRKDVDVEAEGRDAGRGGSV
jgi:hypothetical protein